MKNIEIWQTKDSIENPKPGGKGPNARQVPSITYYPAAKQLTDGAVLIFPGGNHGLGLAQDNPSVHQWCGLLLNWLQNYIK